MKCVLVKTPNKFEVVYGEVSGGLPFGPSAHRKKRFLDKSLSPKTDTLFDMDFNYQRGRREYADPRPFSVESIDFS
ncbi:unnamed protein product [Rhizophagus irregularis]|nr:unnamed protein product [Rhizophagus irregularis]